MLEALHLAAIVKHRGTPEVVRIPLHQSLQRTLSDDWFGQYSDFTTNMRRVSFDAGYRPGREECFVLEDLTLPSWLRYITSATILQVSRMKEEEVITKIKGLAAFVSTRQGKELVLFQNFVPSRLIQPRRSIVLEGRTYKSLERTGLVLDKRLSAVYERKEDQTDGVLLFKNYRTVNTFCHWQISTKMRHDSKSLTF